MRTSIAIGLLLATACVRETPDERAVSPTPATEAPPPAPQPPPEQQPPAEPPPAEPAPVAETTDATGDLQAAMDAGIRRIDDVTYEIDRALIDRLLGNPTAVAKSARVVPSVLDGKPNGFKLYAIRPSSLYARIGILNGDTLTGVNGLELSSAEKALEAYTHVRDASRLSVAITRRGKPITLTYNIK